MVDTNNLLKEIRACKICKGLPLAPRPIVQFSPNSKLLIVGQAPGRITHNKEVPFDDPSGDRLRSWIGVNRDIFYDDQKVSIVPVGFCYPGTGKNGDLPPRAECAQAWRAQILNTLPSVELTLIIGRYAIDWHLPEFKQLTVTEAVKNWKQMWPGQLALPHPSPRNNRWLSQNPWFNEEVLPALQEKVKLLF